MYHKLYECKKCGSHNFIMVHIAFYKQYGIYCADCGTWLKWGNKSDVKLFSANKDIIMKG